MKWSIESLIIEQKEYVVRLLLGIFTLSLGYIGNLATLLSYNVRPLLSIIVALLDYCV